MFKTIGRTWRLAGKSWAVLQQDRELVAFPLMSLVAIAAVIGVFALVASATGSLDTLRGTTDPITHKTTHDWQVIDGVLLVLLYVSVNFVVIFFNAALISAAITRLRGGDPTVADGLRATLPHIHDILGWAIIAASVGLILQLMRERAGIFGRIALAIIGGVWAYLTFFVVPVLVVNGVGPFEAIRQSSSLFKRTWGEQVTANFGFGLIYFAGALVAFLPAAFVFAIINPIAGVVVGLVIGVFAFGVVAAVEGIFKAALFQYATNGSVPAGFDGSDFGTIYSPKH